MKKSSYGLRDMADLLCQITADCCYFPNKREIIYQGFHCPTGSEDAEQLRNSCNIKWGVPSYIDYPVFYVGVDMGCTDSTVIHAISNPECKSLREVLSSASKALFVELPPIYGKEEVLKQLALM